MKTSLPAILLGVTALGLGSAIAYVKRTPAPAQAAVVEPGAPAVPATTTRSRGPDARPATTPAPPAFAWAEVESQDYKQYIANLRAIGCPEQTIRDIILAEVDKLYAARETPLKAKGTDPNTPKAEAATAEIERRRQLREVQNEKRALVKELLGIDLPLEVLPSTGSRDYAAFELALKSLPVEKRDAVQTLQETYWQQSDTLKARFGKECGPEFAAESQKLKSDLRTELAKVLSPVELEDYEIRTSPAAKSLGTQLATFAPTEDEFRQIFRASQRLEDQMTAVAADPQNAAKLAQTTKLRMEQELTDILGADRFAEFQRAQDGTYQTLQRLGQRYGLTQEAIVQAYELEKAARTPPPGSPKLSTQERQAAQQRLSESLTALLGEKAARAYRSARGGFRAPEMEQ